MIVEFKTNSIFNSIKDIYVRKDKKTLKIFYGGNGDLYFDIYGEYKKEIENIYSFFEIDTTDEIYPYFDKLYNDIINYEREDIVIKNRLEGLVNDCVIEWYSDEIYDEKANLLIIIKESDKIYLKFVNNPYDPNFGFSIRICNSGSKYDPINLVFVNLYNDLQKFELNDETKKLNLK